MITMLIMTMILIIIYDDDEDDDDDIDDNYDRFVLMGSKWWRVAWSVVTNNW